ncbi:MAG: N-acetyltransferase [Proteobacteria bacterium]|nr:N-acetyltransferase [Pseudomonadota bacterium]
MIIRTENAENYQQVRNLHLVSFPEEDEASLVDALRADGDAELSLIAVIGNDVVGHVMCSRMQAPFRALGLAPVAVLPNFRKQGIADRLIRSAIEKAKTEAWEGIFLLGDPEYYQRFGFSVPAAANFQSPYAGPYLMALALKDKTLPVQTGVIEFAPAFGNLG